MVGSFHATIDTGGESETVCRLASGEVLMANCESLEGEAGQCLSLSL